MSNLNIEFIHDLYLKFLRTEFPDIKIFLEGQSKVSEVTPRIMYVPLQFDNGPAQRNIKSYDGNNPNKVTYTDFVYETYRYSIVVNEETKGAGGEDFYTLINDLSKKFYWYIRTDAFNNEMKANGLCSILQSGLQDGTINKAPFYERRKFFDLIYGYNDKIEFTEGSIIQTANYTRTNP